MVSTKIKAAFVAFVMTAVILGGQVSASVVSKDSTDKSKASGLTLDKDVTVTLQSKDEVGLYSYTPSKSGIYRVIFTKVKDYQLNLGFYSYGNDLSSPIEQWMYVSTNKDIVHVCYSFPLTQGKTYYFKARTNSSSKNEYKMKLVYGSDSTTSKIGWVNLNNKWYFCNITGQFTEGGYWIDGELYWFNNDYTMLTGWLTLDNGQNWRYFDLGKGNMVKGWKQINGKWFFFDNTGLMVSGWKEINKTWYYFTTNGNMATGWQKIGGVWYYFNTSGAMATGWKAVGGKWYYFNTNGSMKTGWLLDGGNWYFLNYNDGDMVTGSKNIGGKVYNFNSSGICTNP